MAASIRFRVLIVTRGKPQEHGMREAEGRSVKLDDTDIEVPFSEIFD